MKKFIPLTFCLFIASLACAQDQPCDSVAIMNVKGKWTTTVDNIVFPDPKFPASQYGQLKTRIDKIAVLYQQAYPQPMGMLAKWYRSIRGSSTVENGPVPYQFNSLYLAWYCNQHVHKILLGTETGTWSYVFVNDLHWFLNDQYDKIGMKIDGAEVYTLPKIKGEWRGLPVYDVSAGGERAKAVLLTHNNQVPYKPISRLSYLQVIKQKKEADKKSQLAAMDKMPVKTEEEEEKIRQNQLASIEKNYPVANQAKAKERYLKNYKTDRQRKEEDRQRSAKYYDDDLKIIDDTWKSLSSAALQEPAVIDRTMSSFKDFSTLEKGGTMLVVFDPAYFNKQLPKAVAQTIMLYWAWDNDPPGRHFKRQIEYNFPIEKLKEMIDK